MLKPERVSAAIKSGVNQKLSDGRGLYLFVKNGRGFWIYQFWNVGPTKGNRRLTAIGGANAWARSPT